MGGYLEIFGIINEDKKCFDVGVIPHGELDDKFLNSLRVNNLPNITALKYCINQVIYKCIKSNIKFVNYMELRKKDAI